MVPAGRPTVGTACRFSVALTLQRVGLKVGLVDTWTPYDVAPVTRSHDSTGMVPSLVPLGARPVGVGITALAAGMPMACAEITRAAHTTESRTVRRPEGRRVTG